jgi:hypothetical protein
MRLRAEYFFGEKQFDSSTFTDHLNTAYLYLAMEVKNRLTNILKKYFQDAAHCHCKNNYLRNPALARPPLEIF